MKSVTYKEVNAEVFIEFRKWLIMYGNHCGYLSYDGSSYRGTIIFIQNTNKDDSMNNFLNGIEELAKLIKKYA